MLLKGKRERRALSAHKTKKSRLYSKRFTDGTVPQPQIKSEEKN